MRLGRDPVSHLLLEVGNAVVELFLGQVQKARDSVHAVLDSWIKRMFAADEKVQPQTLPSG